LTETLPAKAQAKNDKPRASHESPISPRKKHAAVSALLTVIGILTVGALAKTDVTTQLFHLGT
jgi:hypothetical protein